MRACGVRCAHHLANEPNIRRNRLQGQGAAAPPGVQRWAAHRARRDAPGEIINPQTPASPQCPPRAWYTARARQRKTVRSTIYGSVSCKITVKSAPEFTLKKRARQAHGGRGRKGHARLPQGIRGNLQLFKQQSEGAGRLRRWKFRRPLQGLRRRHRQELQWKEGHNHRFCIRFAHQGGAVRQGSHAGRGHGEESLPQAARIWNMARFSFRSENRRGHNCGEHGARRGRRRNPLTVPTPRPQRKLQLTVNPRRRQSGSPQTPWAWGSRKV